MVNIYRTGKDIGETLVAQQRVCESCTRRRKTRQYLMPAESMA